MKAHQEYMARITAEDAMYDHVITMGEMIARNEIPSWIRKLPRLLQKIFTSVRITATIGKSNSHLVATWRGKRIYDMKYRVEDFYPLEEVKPTRKKTVKKV